jgi:uncharacterized protein (DUF952 family)
LSLFHITEREAWRAAGGEQTYRALTLDTEGFIHLSTEAQWLRVAHTFYRGRADLVLLELDPERLTAPVRFETVGGEQFPHLYGPLDCVAVTAAHVLIVGSDGDFLIPRGVTGVDRPEAP